MKELAMQYVPLLHMDEAEPIPVRAVGYTIFTKDATYPACGTAAAPNSGSETALTGGTRSPSFPKRVIRIPQGIRFVLEYAYYFDYDIEHMYDLEHIWVYVDEEGRVADAEGSFHGKYLKLLPDLPEVLPSENGHVHAFCQPGKHAMLPIGGLTRLYPGWDTCCQQAGGSILVGGPFESEWSPTGKAAFTPTEEENQLCDRYLKNTLAFTPTLRFRDGWSPTPEQLIPWTELYDLIPQWIKAECHRLYSLPAPEI